ncbi:universal stress protein [Owenweeksia hongkongensis]|uniref:universal stress protein n=1 Tax=Owenweeksia hongkongensis TaxID=253245 RepID=UPI003A9339B9
MKVLFPTDFSENAELAAEFAIDIAKRTKGSIVAFHAYDVPYSERSMTTSLLHEMKDIANKHMQEFEAKVLSSSGVDFQTQVSLGNPIRLSKELCEKHNIDIVVLGTKGASGIEELLIGSNAASVIQNIDTPVLVIPPNSQVKEIRNIVLATDMDLRKKERPLLRLKAFANIYGAKINILHFQDDRGAKEGSRDFLETHLSDVPHSYAVLAQKDNLDKDILEYCQSKNADMVTAITKRYGFFEGLFRSSLTSKLAYHTNIPMLALHEPK